MCLYIKWNVFISIYFASFHGLIGLALNLMHLWIRHSIMTYICTCVLHYRSTSYININCNAFSCWRSAMSLKVIWGWYLPREVHIDFPRYTWPQHDDVIKWNHFPRNWPFVRKIHRSPVNFPHKGQWRGALMFSLIYAWINDWVNNREAGDLRRQHGHYDVIVMVPTHPVGSTTSIQTRVLRTHFVHTWADTLYKVFPNKIFDASLLVNESMILINASLIGCLFY